uniref:Mitochondrial import receptor subunit tomm-70 n=1 Tax=Caenorhabditis elegans TaxID=6239 RepID=TOM70_CAEEL|nr:RecName: Full=Mitochondrial import receptor subunit tomm-70; AltName: Full=Translocase of outer mitochondrial membrane 70 [Caenorhabditis elegans]
MVETTGISDQTKKVLIGVAAAATVAGVGYLVYKSFGGSDLERDLEEIKALGNLKFKEKQYDSALEAFTKGVEKAGPNSSDQIVAMLYQNRAACREKVGHSPFDILNDCMAALKVDKKYTKAYLRAAKALNDVGKKQDALAYLLAAFTLDSSLNKTNFEFFGKLLAIEPMSDCHIGKPLKIEDVKPQPVALFRIQQWCDTWDILDLFKTDLTRFEPEVLSEDQKQYQLALEKFKKGKYEELIDLLTEENSYPPAMILRGKMLSYSTDPNEATRYIDKVGAKINELIGSEEDEERKKLMRDAFDILKIELMYTMADLDKFLESVPKDDKERLFKLYSFASIFVVIRLNHFYSLKIWFQYNGCVLDTAVTNHEQQMMADTNNANRLLTEAEKNGTLTPHLSMIVTFLKLCTSEDYADVHRRIREMEELAESRSTHFNLVLMSKVYMMTNNEESSKKLLEEAARITTRYLVPSRHLQTADLHVHKPEAERLRLTTESANAAIAVDPFNFSAHVLHLLGTNGPEPMIKKENYERAMESIRNAALFAPPRELLMLKRMIPLMNAKKRAAEMLDMY